MLSSTLVPILLVLMLVLGVGLRLIPWVFRRPLLRGGLTIAAAATGAGAIWVLDAWADGLVPTLVRGLLFGGIAAAGVIIIVRHLRGLPDVSAASATAGLRDETAGLRDDVPGSLDEAGPDA